MAISKIIVNGVVKMDVTSNTATEETTLIGYTGTKRDGTTFTGIYNSSSSDSARVGEARVGSARI